MKVSVRLFATLRVLAGWTEREWTIADGATVRDLVAAIHAELPQLALDSRVYHVAVNEEYTKLDAPLHDGDRVGIFPPVSGGAM
jgi:molybdopterin synthase sulfur carrier subunit